MPENPATPAQGSDQGQGNDPAPKPQPPAPPADQSQGQSPNPHPSEPKAPEPSEQSDEQAIEHATREELLSEVQRLRRENFRRRTSTQEATQTAAEQAKSELAQQIGKALGIIDDGDNTPDAEKLTQQLTEQTQAAKQAQLELAVYRAASSHGADAAALLDSRSFLEKVADLDPTNTDELNAAIKEVVENNPRLQTGQTPPKRSGNQLNQRQGQEPVAQTPEELANLIPRGF